MVEKTSCPHSGCPRLKISFKCRQLSSEAIITHASGWEDVRSLLLDIKANKAKVWTCHVDGKAENHIKFPEHWILNIYDRQANFYRVFLVFCQWQKRQVLAARKRRTCCFWQWIEYFKFATRKFSCLFTTTFTTELICEILFYDKIFHKGMNIKEIISKDTTEVLVPQPWIGRLFYFFALFQIWRYFALLWKYFNAFTYIILNATRNWRERHSLLSPGIFSINKNLYSCAISNNFSCTVLNNLVFDFSHRNCHNTTISLTLP